MATEKPDTQQVLMDDDGEEPEIKRGVFEAWVAKAITNPERTYKAMFYTATIFFLVTTLFPFYWLFQVALTPRNQLQDVGLVPSGFDPSLLAQGDLTMGTNPGVFAEVFTIIPFHRYMFNSFAIATVTTIIVIVVASLAGYVFGRLEFPGRGALMLAVLIISYFPPAAFLIPLFDAFLGNAIVVPFLGIELFSVPRIVNNPWSMITPFSALFLPLSIFILATFYGQIPDGLEDAARVEGTTRLGALVRVIMPLSAPGLATAAVLTFISVYNEYFFSSLMALENTPGNWSPLVGGILSYQTQYTTSFNLMAAASIVGVLPVVVLVVVAQERIVSGLTQGALKE